MNLKKKEDAIGFKIGIFKILKVKDLKFNILSFKLLDKELFRILY